MPTIDSVFEQALKLSPEQRATLADALDQSVAKGFDNADVEAVWLDEAKRRTAERRAGRTHPQPWEQVYDQMKGDLDDPAA